MQSTNLSYQQRRDQVIQTQKQLQRLDFDLKVDGILGPVTKKALFNLSLQLYDRLEDLGYHIDDRMLIGIRMSQDYDNLFTDIYVCADLYEPYQMRLYDCSTRPGLYGQGGVLHPKWHQGIYGVAVLKPGQYLESFSLQGPWWSGLPFLYQIKPVSVYRDHNRDMALDRVQEHTGLFGINHHSWSGYKYSYVNNLSQGCQVFKADTLPLILPFWQRLAKETDNKISYTLIDI